jgi:phenylacetate-CoA ligase
MVSIRGNNVFPSSIDALLCEFPEIAEYRTTVITRRSMPHLKIEIEPAFPSDQAPDKLMALLDRLHRAVKDRLNFQAEIIAVPALPRFEHKARRFFRE